MDQALSQQIVRLGLDALAVFIPILVALAANCLKNYANNQKLIKMKQTIETKQLIAQEAVLFTQQVFRHCEGERKYQAAMEVLAGKFQRYGIVVTHEELDELVHTALKSAKKEFKEVWDSIGQTEMDRKMDVSLL
ncbi:MAG: hypothetical protein APF84_05875 [Gracilibacter sp. BRH_c7a]|nr:MAG: hypothetical protein APF84_05875 [Gracilibacter sp. BRH_c7a]